MGEELCWAEFPVPSVEVIVTCPVAEGRASTLGSPWPAEGAPTYPDSHAASLRLLIRRALAETECLQPKGQSLGHRRVNWVGGADSSLGGARRETGWRPAVVPPGGADELGPGRRCAVRGGHLGSGWTKSRTEKRMGIRRQPLPHRRWIGHGDSRRRSNTRAWEHSVCSHQEVIP